MGDLKNCLVCNKRFKRLGIHVKKIHGFDPKLYYDMYVKRNFEEYCFYEKCLDPNTNSPKMTRYVDINIGYNKYCSPECGAKCLISLEKAKQTFIKHYGTTHPLKTEQVKKKIKNTCLKRYNTTSVFSRTEIKEKIVKTNMKRLGVKYPMESSKCRRKQKETCMRRYLTDNVSKHPKIIAKIKRSIKQISILYPTFFKDEEMRYDPEKVNENEIQVHCKYADCKNSKENRGWFTPTRSKIQSRIYAIERLDGNDGSFLYCSEECKNKCHLFGVRVNLKSVKLIFNDYELSIWKYEVLKRQKEQFGYNFCERCNKINNLHVHHERPKKIEPIYALDPDNGIIFCGYCHFEVGHQNECSTGKLAHRKC